MDDHGLSPVVKSDHPDETGPVVVVSLPTGVVRLEMAGLRDPSVRMTVHSPTRGRVIELTPSEALQRSARSMRTPTARQVRVLELLALGYETKQIAWEMGLGSPAVKKHVARLKTRYAAPNRTAVVVAAIRSGDLVVTVSGVTGAHPTEAAVTV